MDSLDTEILATIGDFGWPKKGPDWAHGSAHQSSNIIAKSFLIS